MYHVTPQSLKTARDHGVTAMAGMLVLLALAEHAERQMTMAEAADYANVSPAAMTGTIDKLVALGFVRRWMPEDDRRRVCIGLTAEGAALMDDVVSSTGRIEP